MKDDLTADALRQLVTYDPATGAFKWLVHRNGCVPAGTAAGYKCRDGYRVSIGRRRHYAHRLAWLYTYGNWPSSFIDHIDGNPFNNAIGNLREATGSQNQHNQGKRRTNTSGFKGVDKRRHSKNWRARIYVDGREIILGVFDTAEAAAAAYASAAERLHGEFARTE